MTKYSETYKFSGSSLRSPNSFTGQSTLHRYWRGVRGSGCEITMWVKWLYSGILFTSIIKLNFWRRLEIYNFLQHIFDHCPLLDKIRKILRIENLKYQWNDSPYHLLIFLLRISIGILFAQKMNLTFLAHYATVYDICKNVAPRRRVLYLSNFIAIFTLSLLTLFLDICW